MKVVYRKGEDCDCEPAEDDGDFAQDILWDLRVQIRVFVQSDTTAHLLWKRNTFNRPPGHLYADINVSNLHFDNGKE